MDQVLDGSTNVLVYFCLDICANCKVVSRTRIFLSKRSWTEQLDFIHLDPVTCTFFIGPPSCGASVLCNSSPWDRKLKLLPMCSCPQTNYALPASTVRRLPALIRCSFSFKRMLFLSCSLMLVACFHTAINLSLRPSFSTASKTFICVCFLFAK